MEKMLILDDEKSIVDLLSLVFSKEGYSVDTCLSAVRAIEMIDKEDQAEQINTRDHSGEEFSSNSKEGLLS